MVLLGLDRTEDTSVQTGQDQTLKLSSQTGQNPKQPWDQTNLIFLFYGQGATNLLLCSLKLQQQWVAGLVEQFDSVE